MTAEKLHDALSLLPADLITETDKLRTNPRPKVIAWKRVLPMAACFALLLSCGVFWSMHQSGGKSAPMEMMMQEAAAEAPAAAAPTQPPAAADTAPDAPAENGVITEVPAEEELCIDHSDRFAEETEDKKAASGYCGNMQTTVYLDGQEYTFGGSDSVAMTDILANLAYDPAETCRCMVEFTVDTELLRGIGVNLTEGFARCEQGQAALTEAQVKKLQEIIEALK